MDNVKAIVINLNIQSKNSLSVLMNDDGTINRSGDGTANINSNMYIGVIDPLIFQTLISEFNGEIDKFLGNTYVGKEKAGIPCTIELSLTNDTETKKAKFEYWSGSPGLPREIGELVMKVLELTDSWYKENLKKLKSSGTKWYQFWK